MVAVLSLLVSLTLSFLATRVATVALVLTGLSRSSARFQARSAFTGAGYTTAEAESVVSHPVRRRVVMLLMLAGGAGIATTAATLLLSVSHVGDGNLSPRVIAVAVVGFGLLITAINSSLVERVLTAIIERMLDRYTELDVRDFEHLLHLADDWKVIELHVDDGDWLAGGTLRSLRPRDEGVLVLGIQHPDGSWSGTPDPDVRLVPGDVAVLYGPAATLTELDQRGDDHAGDTSHQAVAAERRRSQDDGS